MAPKTAYLDSTSTSIIILISFIIPLNVLSEVKETKVVKELVALRRRDVF